MQTDARGICFRIGDNRGLAGIGETALAPAGAMCKRGQTARGASVSDTDSFIDEVTEEVKRDRLFALMRKYGWIAVLVVVLIVGGTAWREYRKAQVESAAQDLGDAVLSALEQDGAARIRALEVIEAGNPGAQAILTLLIAAEEGSAGDDAAAIARLEALAADQELTAIYRQIASYKALSRGAETMDPAARRAGLEALAVPGQPLRPLAEEQLALLDVESGDRAAALDRLERLVQDSEASAGLRRRASQLIVALGGTLPES